VEGCEQGGSPARAHEFHVAYLVPEGGSFAGEVEVRYEAHEVKRADGPACVAPA
jgi:hypothetical protein